MKKTSEQTSGLKFFGIGKMLPYLKKYRGMMAAMVYVVTLFRFPLLGSGQGTELPDIVRHNVEAVRARNAHKISIVFFMIIQANHLI